MKKTKLFASLVAVVMLLTTLSTTLVSADEITEANLIISNNIESTAITIKNKTYNLYQVFSATTVTDDDTEDDSIEYTVNEDFYDFFKGKKYTNSEGTEVTIGDYPTTEDAEEISTYNHAATEYINSFAGVLTEATTTTEQELVTLLREYIDEENIEATTTTKSSSYSITGSSSETLTAVDVDLGYYVVFDSLAIDGEVSETDAVTNGSLVTIPGRATDGSLTDDVTISLKGNMPEIEKEIWHNDLTNVSGDNSPTLGTTGSWDEVADYQIGDTVEFRLTVTIPSDLKAYDDYDYTIIDTLSDGLEFNNDIKIYVDSELITQVDGQLHKTTYGDLTDESSENDYTFKMDFDMINIKEGYPSQKVFYVYYTATVLEDTNIYTDYEQNNAVLEFSNNPYDSTSYGKSEDDVYGYTFEIDITKTKGDGVTALADATFALYETTTVDNILTYHQIYLAKSTDNDLEVDTFYPSTGSASDTEGNYAGVITTGDTGKFAITGLDDATEYVLVELDAPEGFNIADPVMINIKATYADNDKGIPTPSLTVSGSTDSLDITIINTSANLLPETGGIGTTVFTITGIVIMLGALAILFLIKTKKTSK